jgi:FkbM family methyltransferase
MTRILWISTGRNAKLGFSRQTNLMLPRVKQAGYEVVMMALGDPLGEPYADRNGILTLASMDDFYGNDAYPLHMEWTQADYSFMLFNAWGLNHDTIGGQPHAVWEMVECEPLRPKDLAAMQGGPRWIATPSRFGMRVLSEAGFDPIYLPMGVDTNVYKPIDRVEARGRVQERADNHRVGRGYDWELGDKFLAVMVGANHIDPPRKGFYEGLAAFKIFHERHPDSALYLHTRMASGQNGVNVMHDIKALGLPDGVLDYPNQYYYANGMIPDGWLNDAYNAADVLLHPSHMEGFGLPIVEAQAAGCPVIVTDYASMPELVFSGTAVEGAVYPAMSGWYWKRPSIDALVEALEEAYQKREDGQRREAARTGALAYDIDKVFDGYMRPTLARIAEEARGHQEWRLARELSQPRQINVNGVTLTVRTQQDEAVARTAQIEYFPDLIDYSQIKRAVDVGAHIGAWSLFVKQQSPNARIVAIEAMPENAALLRKNCNGANADSIMVVEGMCGYTPGEYDMVISPLSTGGPTLVRRETPNPRGGGWTIRRQYEGEMITLKGVFGRVTNVSHPRIDVLKLDCEGGEFDILNNAPERDLTAFHWIVGEYHHELGDINAALARVEQWFDVRAIRPLDEKFGLFCLERK